ncbi:hypothetical protein C8F01DRAFT_1257198 [Mycena amicta]|nr:hypothetical protein C8F01DRAFT_1257198 [Mycena amicta]
MPSSVASSVRSTLGKVKKKLSKAAKLIASSISGSRKSKGMIDLVSSEDVNTSATPNMTKWTSGIYQFFKDDVQVITAPDGSTYQQFNCGHTRCKKRSGPPGVQRVQTKADGSLAPNHSSTSNLKKHAIACWGKDHLLC